MEITGYAWLKRHTTTHRGCGNPDDFAGKILPCLEINPEGDVLVYRDGVGLAMFEPSDVLKSFRCRFIEGYVLPPTKTYFEAVEWMLRATVLSSGDSKLFNAAVIAMSLQKGEYYTEIFR